jgi:hypothetical protein
MTELEKVELQCRRLINAKEHERSAILSESLGYLGLAKAYVELSNEYLKLKEAQNDKL